MSELRFFMMISLIFLSNFSASAHQEGDYVRHISDSPTLNFAGEILSVRHGVYAKIRVPASPPQEHLALLSNLLPEPALGAVAYGTDEANKTTHGVVISFTETEIHIQTHIGLFKMIPRMRLLRVQMSEAPSQQVSEGSFQSLLAPNRTAQLIRPDLEDALEKQMEDQPEILEVGEIHRDNLLLARYPDGTLALVGSNERSTRFIPRVILISKVPAIFNAEIQVSGDIISVHFQNGEVQKFSIEEAIQNKIRQSFAPYCESLWD